MDNSQLDANAIQEEATRLFTTNLNSNNSIVEDVQEKILGSLVKVDPYQVAALSPGERLSLKIWVVIVIELVLQAARRLRIGLCRSADFLYSYNGAFWQVIDRFDLEGFLGRAAEKLGVTEITAKYHKFRTELYKQFQSGAYLSAPVLKADIVLINLLNGTFEITSKGWRLREFRRDDFLKYQLPFSYGEKSTCPKWMEFLNRVLPDKSCQDVLAEFVAYIFTDLKLEKSLLLFGTGANGKSVVFDVLRSILGTENISHISLSSLKSEYHRACLVNKLLNYASEISTKVEADIFKKMTSGEPVEARLPYGQPFIMTRYAKLAFNCNELPYGVEYTEAFFRRFLILPFDVFIPEEERDPNLAKEIISQELSGIFNWILDGLRRLLEQGNFSPCEAARNALEAYRRDSDSVAMFIEEMTYQKVSSKDQATSLLSMYAEYKYFCSDNGFHAVSSPNLRKRLEALGFECPRINIGRLVYAAKNKS